MMDDLAQIAEGLSEKARAALTAKADTPLEYFDKHETILRVAGLCETVPYSGGTLTQLTEEASRLRNFLLENYND